MYSRKKTIAKLVYGFEQLKASGLSIADLTVTADRNAYDSKEFNRRYRSFQVHVLSKLFSKGIRVITRSPVGRMHMHAAVALPFACEGIDWRAFEQAERWRNIYNQTKELSGLRWYKYFYRQFRQSMPESFRKLYVQIKAKARTYGFGHTMLLPVKKNNDALKWYLVKNVPHKRQNRDKGLHYFAAWGLISAVDFKVNTKQYAAYRQRLKLFCTGLGLTSDNYTNGLREVLGAGWHWKCKDMIKNIESLGTQALQYAELKKQMRQYLVRSEQLQRRS